MADGKKGNGANPTMETPKGGPPLLNFIMLYMTLLGLGVIGGYGAFFVMFHERCVGLLQQAEETYNSSKIEWQAKHQQVISEKNECLNPLQKLQGKLQEHSTLAEKHRVLEKQHDEATSKLAALQQSKDESDGVRAKLESQIIEIQTQLKEANQKVAEAVNKKGEIEKDLQTRLEITQNELSQKVVELKELQESNQKVVATINEKREIEKDLKMRLDIAQDELAQKAADFKELQELKKACPESSESSGDTAALESDLKTVTTFVQNRAERMCRMEYGKGPFLIQFNVRFPEEEETQSFQVQLASLTDMPHTIFVLMELISLKSYHGTVIKSAGGGIIEAGNLADADNAVATKVLNRLVKYGYEKPVSFVEISSSLQHEELTVGFVGSGPALAINTADNTKERGPEGRNDPCFGKVVSGHDTLVRIQQAGEDSSFELVSIERVRASQQ